ncbi:MAG: hypothetical protein WBP94_03845 [Rhodomicrobiaceae bacterium]
MTTNDAPEDPPWPANPDPSKEHIYAIGRLSVNYNDLEATLLHLIQIYDDDTYHEITDFLFQKVPTNVRIEWLKKVLSIFERDNDVILSIEHFISAYSICTDNRGLLVHSRIFALGIGDNSLLTAKRSRKTGVLTGYEFPLEVIRRISDEIEFWKRYGSHICAYLNRRSLSQQKLPEGMQPIGPTTLPQISSLPANLLANFPHKENKRPHPPQT